jgi:hypothetical protein
MFVIVFLTAGCKYAFMDNTEIEAQLELMTKLGGSSAETRKAVNELFGEDSFVFAGLAECIEGSCKSKGIRATDDETQLEGSHFFTYKLGSHMSTFIVLPTHVFASWYFDSDGRLAEIKIIKQVDGL